MQNLFSKLDEPRRWVYWLTAIPFLLAAEFAFEANAHWPYYGVAAVLALAFFWPCRFSWYLATTLYAVTVAAYLWEAVADFWRLGLGIRAKNLVDADDAFGFFVWLAMLIVVLLLLWWARPSRKYIARGAG